MMALAAADSLRRMYAREETGLGRRLGQPSPMSMVRRYRDAGQYDSAAAVLRSIVDENPMLVPAWMALEDLHLRQEDYTGAVRVREERIRATMGETAAPARRSRNCGNASTPGTPRRTGSEGLEQPDARTTGRARVQCRASGYGGWSG